MITLRLPAKELFWILPFICVGLMLLSLARPVPVFPQPPNGRLVIDAKGRQVVIPPNFKGVVPLHWLADFLQKTHAPEKLVNAGTPEGQSVFAFNHWQRSLMDWVFPRVLRDDSLWDFPNDLESILAHDQDGYVYLGDFFYLGPQRLEENQKRFGLRTVEFYPLSWADKDEVIFTMTRVLNDVIGQKEKAEIYIADYKRDVEDLLQELDLETVSHRPRVLNLWCSLSDWTFIGATDEYFDPRLGISGATKGHKGPTKGHKGLGREQDVERILIMNPDIIFAAPIDIMSAPRWQGLKAVRENRVYGGTRFSPYIWDLNFQPLGLRHMAEILYPDRLKPKLRWMMREKFEKNYGYRLKDYEIDWLLNLETNRDSVGYLARFGRPDQEDEELRSYPDD